MVAGRSRYTAPLMMASSSRSCVTRLESNYAARALRFPDRAIFAFLAGLAVTDTESVGAATALSLLELSNEVVKTSR
jgi:hypothetical protein